MAGDDPEGVPVCGRDSRLQSLHANLERLSAEPGARDIQPMELVGWFLQSGFSLGFSRDELLFSLRSRTDWLALAETATPEDIGNGKSPPEFTRGQLVEVVVNARNITYRKGWVRDMLWHHQHRCWHFFLEENGKPISRRYEARDLRAMDVPA